MNRFGEQSIETIDETIKETEPLNTQKSKSSIWRQFSDFCDAKKYCISQSTSEEELATILKDWAFNMKKTNGQDYKETVVKTMWNVTAKLLQEKFHKEYHRKIDPFAGIAFKSARDARNSKRRILQAVPEKRKVSSVALEKSEYEKMVDVYDEETPDGLQKKFYLIAAVELAWRGGEGAACLVHYFREEMNVDNVPTGRIEYNPIFSKTSQGGAHKCADSKWLIPNKVKPNHCPVRLFKKLISKRLQNNRIKTDRLFLTVNRSWRTKEASNWYKNMPIGRNEILKWNRKSAELAGFDTTNKKITNHSSRATAVSSLAKAGVNEQQLIKISGHSSSHSIKPYLQLDKEHHESIVNQMRGNNSRSTNIDVNRSTQQKHVVYENCTFTCNNLYIS